MGFLRKNKPRVVVAMSGGVDSSTAAALLAKQEFDVIGICMKLWPSRLCGQTKNRSCCSTRDLEDARFVAGQLGISFYAIDLSGDFKKEVMDYFYKEYTCGRTPNPCILCNNMIKFGSLLKKAKELKADFIATGHYAKVTYDAKTKRFALRRGKDKAKDQSYFLFGLTQRQLRSIIFPLSGYLKSEVKEICSDFGLKVANKSPSQEICFVWDNNYPDFLKKIYGIKPVCGQIVNKEGKVLGQHHGVIFFTIGQRRGLGLGGNKIPLYVIGIDAKKNRVIVGTKEDLEKNTLFADGLNWINIRNFQKPIKVKAQIRYNHPAADASVYPLARDCVKVVFDEPQLAIAPGQAVVFYKGDEVLGGGWIR